MGNNGVSLPERMKRYELAAWGWLTRRTPVIIRVDGRCFHTLTRSYTRPWDKTFVAYMVETAKYLVSEIQGCVFAYIQSDEISLLLTDYQRLGSQAWFDYELPKIISISAGLASVRFSRVSGHQAVFDSRAFNVPKEDVCNYFVWRQRDCVRNSIMGLAQSQFSHKALLGVNCDEAQEKLFQEKGINWSKCPTAQKRGICLIKGPLAIIEDREPPEFTQRRNYIEWVMDVEEKPDTEA